jgi:hypothetical protein
LKNLEPESFLGKPHEDECPCGNERVIVVIVRRMAEEASLRYAGAKHIEAPGPLLEVVREILGAHQREVLA